jgi:hypothetical protein
MLESGIGDSLMYGFLDRFRQGACGPIPFDSKGAGDDQGVLGRGLRKPRLIPQSDGAELLKRALIEGAVVAWKGDSRGHAVSVPALSGFVTLALSGVIQSIVAQQFLRPKR